MTFTNTAFSATPGAARSSLPGHLAASASATKIPVRVAPAASRIPRQSGRSMHLPVSTRVTNGNPVSVTLSVLPAVARCSWRSRTDTRSLAVVSLLPSETKLVDLVLRMKRSSPMSWRCPTTTRPAAHLPSASCLMPAACPAAGYPNLHGICRPSGQVRPNDLGSAPDQHQPCRSGHDRLSGRAGDLPDSLRSGDRPATRPRHAHRVPFHLGQRQPWKPRRTSAPTGTRSTTSCPRQHPRQRSRRRRHQPGTVEPGQLPAGGCRAGLHRPQAVPPLHPAWHARLSPALWVDGNRNGTWRDAVRATQPAPNIVIDYAVNVVGLGAGLHAQRASERVPLPCG